MAWHQPRTPRSLNFERAEPVFLIVEFLVSGVVLFCEHEPSILGRRFSVLQGGATKNCVLFGLSLFMTPVKTSFVCHPDHLLPPVIKKRRDAPQSPMTE